MKILAYLLLLFCANTCFAVSWNELSKEEAGNYHIEVKAKYIDRDGCFKIKAKFPNTVSFKDLGDRLIWGAQYKKIITKNKGWQLTSKGTQVALQINSEGNFKKVASICIGSDDIKHSYLSLIYGVRKAVPPMVLLIKLSDYAK